MDPHELHSSIMDRRFPIPWPGHFIGNAWVLSKGAMRTSQNPNTGKGLMEAGADTQAIQAAVAAAQIAAPRLAQMALGDRLAVLGRFVQVLTDNREMVQAVLGIECGKPRWEAESDFASATSFLQDLLKDAPRTLDRFARLSLGLDGEDAGPAPSFRPIGSIAAYLPFSSPLTSMAYFFGSTLVAGCPLVVVTSAHAMLLALVSATLAQAAEVPSGSLGVVFGGFNMFQQLLTSEGIAGVIYTGSREHCETIRYEKTRGADRVLVLQSGGKNAVVVDSSADLTEAVRLVMLGAVKAAGQLCSSTNRVFVERSIADNFAEALGAAVSGMTIGRTDVFEGTGPFMGPLYSARSVEKLLKYQTMAHREARKTILWAKHLRDFGGGFFASPGVHWMAEFNPLSAYQSNVLFGPDIAIYDYERPEQVVEMINSTECILATALVGAPEKVRSLADRLNTPNIILNGPTVETGVAHPTPGRQPHGGHKIHGSSLICLMTNFHAVITREGIASRISAWPHP